MCCKSKRAARAAAIQAAMAQSNAARSGPSSMGPQLNGVRPNTMQQTYPPEPPAYTKEDPAYKPSSDFPLAYAKEDPAHQPPMVSHPAYMHEKQKFAAEPEKQMAAAPGWSQNRSEGAAVGGGPIGGLIGLVGMLVGARPRRRRGCCQRRRNRS